MEGIIRALNKLIVDKYEWIKGVRLEEFGHEVIGKEIIVIYIIDPDTYEFDEAEEVFKKTKNLFKMLMALLEYKLSQVQYEYGDGRTLIKMRNM